MADVAGDGWELISASIHKVGVPRDGGILSQADRSTMFWRKPAVAVTPALSKPDIP
jgi:hypothetical protein